MSLRSSSKKARIALQTAIRKGIAWSKVNIPPGLRTITGLLLILGGIFGLLPILGFWMLPLGIAIVSLDIIPLWVFIRERLGVLRTKNLSDE